MGISSIKGKLSDWFWSEGKTKKEDPVYTIETGEKTRESLKAPIDSRNGNENTGQYNFGSGNKSAGTTTYPTNKNAAQTGSTVGSSIYDNDARQADRKAQAEEKKQEVAGPVVYDTRQTDFVTDSQMKTYNNGLSYIKGSNVSQPSAGVSTVDHNYTGANDNSYTVWDDDKMRTGIGSIDSGLGEAVFEAVKPIAQTAKKAYDKVNGYVDISDIFTLPYNLMTEGTRLDNDYYLTAEEKEKRDELGYKEILGIGIGPGNEYMNGLEGEIEKRKGKEIANSINNDKSDLMKYIGSFLVNMPAGFRDGINNIKNTGYAIVGEGEKAPESAFGIAADATINNLGSADRILASIGRYGSSELLPATLAAMSPVAGKIAYGLNEAGREYGYAIDEGAEPYDAFKSAGAAGAIGVADEYVFGNMGGVAKATNSMKAKAADKIYDSVRLIVKDEKIARKLSEIGAVAFLSLVGSEIELNTEKYLRNEWLGEENEISFTDRATLEEAVINMVIDEAFELADRGEIELKSGNDIQDVENGKGKGYDGGKSNIYEYSYNDFISNQKEIKKGSSEETNQWFIENISSDYKAPYKVGTFVSEIELSETTTFVRVYDKTPSGSGMYGNWIMRKEDIEGLSPLEIKDKYALPSVPVYICDVEIEKGSIIRVGEVNPIDEWGSGGGIQYDLMNQRIGVFKNERLLEENDV